MGLEFFKEHGGTRYSTDRAAVESVIEVTRTEIDGLKRERDELLMILGFYLKHGKRAHSALNLKISEGETLRQVGTKLARVGNKIQEQQGILGKLFDQNQRVLGIQSFNRRLAE